MAEIQLKIICRWVDTVRQYCTPLYYGLFVGKFFCGHEPLIPVTEKIVHVETNDV